jgi:hypothetical protein
LRLYVVLLYYPAVVLQEIVLGQLIVLIVVLVRRLLVGSHGPHPEVLPGVLLGEDGLVSQRPQVDLFLAELGELGLLLWGCSRLFIVLYYALSYCFQGLLDRALEREDIVKAD